jgi:DNA-binding CsgD family transcriptional regulator/tetratricopeptide (TPR) repeat protein
VIGGRVSSPRFIARAEELSVLEAALERAAGGNPVVALVAAEAGMGKTRLVDEFSSRAYAAGARVLAGAAVDVGESALPYAAIVEILRRVPSEAIAALPEPLAAELSVLIPEVGQVPPQRTEPAAASAARTRLFGAALRLMENLGQDGPAVVVLEDVHWIDRSTQDMLGFLVRGLQQTAILLILTFRPDELSPEHELRPLLAELQRGPRTVRVELSPFSRDETSAQIEAIVGDVPEAALVDRVHARSDGNPFFTEELVANGEGIDQLGHVHDILLTRVARLSEDAHAAVRVAAAVGRSAQHSLLATVSGIPDDRLDAALREAVDAHLLVLDAEAEGYRFRHALLHEAVYGELLPGERRRLHARVAAILSRQAAEEDGASASDLSELARHWVMADRPREALASSVAAGRAAEKVPALADANGHYAVALELWPRVADAEDVARMSLADLLERAAECRSVGAGDPAGAAALTERALAVLGDDADPLRLADLTSRLAMSSWEMHGSATAGLELHRRALAMVGDEPTVVGARVLARYANALLVGSDFAEAERRARAGAGMAHQVGAVREEADALVTLFTCLGARGEMDEARKLMSISERLALAARDPRVLQRGVTDALYVLDLWGAYEEALEVATRGLALLSEVGVERHGRMCVASAAAAILCALGRLDEAIDLIGRERFVMSGDTMPVHLELANLHRLRGEWPAARAHLGALASVASDPIYATPALTFRADVELWDGRLDEALEAIHAAEQILVPDEIIPLTQVFAVAVRAQAERRQRDPAAAPDARAEADRLLGRLDAMLLDVPARPPAALGHQLTARAERSRLDDRPRPDAWRDAAAHWEALGHPYDVAYARWREAQALAASGRGQRDRLAGVLRAAKVAAEVGGAKRLAHEIADLARRTRVALQEGPPVPEIVFPDLTPREREVLRLVASGKTNRQIAGHLFITDKTASVHVSNILSKLGVASRGEAAALAHREGFDVDDGSVAPAQLIED